LRELTAVLSTVIYALVCSGKPAFFESIFATLFSLTMIDGAAAATAANRKRS
jgi:hypothetical protein